MCLFLCRAAAGREYEKPEIKSRVSVEFQVYMKRFLHSVSCCNF